MNEFLQKLDEVFESRYLKQEASSIPRIVEEALSKTGHDFLEMRIRWHRDRFIIYLIDQQKLGEFELFSISIDGYIHPKFSLKKSPSWFPLTRVFERATGIRSGHRFLEYGRISLGAVPSERYRLVQALASSVEDYGRSIQIAYRTYEKG